MFTRCPAPSTPLPGAECCLGFVGRRRNESPPATHCHLVLWGCGSGGQLQRFAHGCSNDFLLYPSAPAVLCTRPPTQQWSQLAGKVCSEGPQSRRPWEPAFAAGWTAGPALFSLSNLLLLCGGLWFDISFLHHLEPQQPPAWPLKILVKKRYRREREVFSGSKRLPSQSGGPPQTLWGTGDVEVLPSTCFVRSFLRPHLLTEARSFSIATARHPRAPGPSPSPHRRCVCTPGSHLKFHFLKCSLFTARPSPLAGTLLSAGIPVCFARRAPSRAPGT